MAAVMIVVTTATAMMTVATAAVTTTEEAAAIDTVTTAMAAETVEVMEAEATTVHHAVALLKSMPTAGLLAPTPQLLVKLHHLAASKSVAVATIRSAGKAWCSHE